MSTQGAPAIEPSSIYGMRTYTNRPEFGMLPDKMVVAFPPSEISKLTMHVLKGGQELTGGSFYPTDTPYPNFKVLRYQPLPEIVLSEQGDYVIEFRQDGTAVSAFPFKIEKKSVGDAFNPVTYWEYITPVDRMGTLNYSNSNDSDVWFSAWIAPRREGIAMRSTATIRLFHNGTEIAHALNWVIQEPDNARKSVKMMKMPTSGRAAFKKSDLLKLSGTVTGVISVGGKAIRTFTWTVANGAIKPHPRSVTGYEPKTGYFVPRRLAGGEAGYQFFHLEEVAWSESK